MRGCEHWSSHKKTFQRDVILCNGYIHKHNSGLTLRSPPLGGSCTSAGDFDAAALGGGAAAGAALGAGGGGAAAACSLAGGGGAAAASLGGGGAAEAAPASPIATTATFVPGVTVSPSFARICNTSTTSA